MSSTANAEKCALAGYLIQSIKLGKILRNNRISREFNMAAITARSAKKSVSYHDLYNLSTADLLFDEKKKKRRPASKSLGFFEAER